jgi:hypothetical protein
VNGDRDLRPYPAAREITLVDLVDRVLAGGVTISGELVLSVADVDLVVVELRALLASVSTAFAAGVAPASLLPPDMEGVHDEPRRQG